MIRTRGYTYVPVVSPILTWLIGKWLWVNGWTTEEGHLVRR